MNLPRGLWAQALPAGDQASEQRALAAYDAGQMEVAEPLLRDLARRYPKNYEAQEALGSLYVEKGDVARAVSYLEQACRLAPRQALAQQNLGVAYLKLGRAAESVRALTVATELDPGNASAQSNLGQALMLQGQPGAAAKAFARAAEVSPDDAELRYNRAVALYESGAGHEAAVLLEASPGSAESDQAQLLIADAEEQAGEYKEALTHFQAAARLNPTDGNLYALDAELLRHWTWDEAIAVAHFGAERYPASPHFDLIAGIALYAKSDYAGAVTVLSRMLERDPDNATIADLLGRSCSLLGDGEDAGCQGMYDFARRHPGNAVTTTYAAVAILHAPKEKQDLDRAAAMLQSAIQADPKYAEAYYQMGVLEQLRLAWAQSAASLERAIALRPESAEAHYRLSRAYTHLGRREDAQAQIALHEKYAEQSKNHLDVKLQEVVRFLLKPS